MLVKRSAIGIRENHQGIKAVDSEFREGIGTTSNEAVGSTSTKQVDSRHYSICRRRAGSAHAGYNAFYTYVISDLVSYLTYVVSSDIASQGFFIAIAEEIVFGHIHTAHRRSHNKSAMREVFWGKTRIGNRLL